MASPTYATHPWSMTWRNNWENIRHQISGTKEQTRGRQGKITRVAKETFASTPTYLSTNMPVRVMTQLLFDAVNA